MKLKLDCGDITIETDFGSLEIGVREEGIVISPVERFDKVMKLKGINKSVKINCDFNIFWLKVEKEKK